MLVPLGAFLWRVARAPAHSRPPSASARVSRLATSALAATAILWLTGKVFSPQYLTWSIPLVLAVPGRTGIRLAWVTIGAMALTQLYQRGFYDLVVEQRPIGLLALAARQAILFVLLALAARSALRPGEPEPEPA
jgi:hypothetical protein